MHLKRITEEENDFDEVIRHCLHKAADKLSYPDEAQQRVRDRLQVVNTENKPNNASETA